MDLAEFYKKGIGWMTTQHEIVFLRPANLNEIISIGSGLLMYSEDQLILEFVMLDKEGVQLKSMMQTRLVPVNLKTGKKEPHSTEFMEFLTGKLLPGLDNNNLPSMKERITLLKKREQ